MFSKLLLIIVFFAVACGSSSDARRDQGIVEIRAFASGLEMLKGAPAPHGARAEKLARAIRTLVAWAEAGFTGSAMPVCESVKDLDGLQAELASEGTTLPLVVLWLAEQARVSCGG